MDYLLNIYNDWKWYEYGPLEARSKATKTMQEMWNYYLLRNTK